MEFHVLGPVGLRVDGERLELGSVKERTLLAALVLDLGRPLGMDALVGRLWDGEPPPHARESTHTYVSRLRKRLRRAGHAPGAPLIVSRTHTYALEADPDSVDWHRYQRLVGVAATSEDERAIGVFASADALWRGEALAGLPGLWAETARRSLAERRLAATISRIGAGLRLGHFAELVGELTALTAQYPGDETLLGHLTLAYYGSRRYTDALHVHERTRRMLMTEYGARPGPALERIHVGVLNHTPVADLVRAVTTAPVAAASTASSPGPATARPPRNLPSQPPLIGRNAELRLLTASLGSASRGAVLALETVSGMAGVGKTAVAVHTAGELAETYPDAQLYLDLRAHSLLQDPLTPGTALATLLRLLGAPAANIPVDVEGRAELWRTMLAQRRSVIVLDDVVDAEQVRPLLPSDTPSVVILTSRRHLTGLPTTRSVLLDVLPEADAIALFRRFAGEERTQDTTEVARIVRLCDYLPLAVELVANRFQARNAWTLATLRARLARSPGGLSEIRDTEHEIVRPFDLSYDTLTASQRTAFRHLSLHPGVDFTAEAAAAVLDLPLDATERLLEDLLACHLLREPVPERYQYHDLLRQYAYRLVNSDDDTQVRDTIGRRMISFYIQAVDAADRLAYPHRLRVAPWPGTHPASMPAWSDSESARSWLRTERENVLAIEQFAGTAGRPELAAQLAFCISGFLNAECHWQDAGEILRRAVGHLSGTDAQPLLCRVLLDLSDALANTGRYREAAESGQHALEIARATGDTAAVAEALRAVGALQWHRGEHAAALEHFQQSFAIHAEAGYIGNQARLHNNIGVAELYLGENDRALEHFQKARERFTEIGDHKSAAVALNNVADRHTRVGRLDLARQALEEAVSVLDDSGNRYEQATARSSLADILTELGDTEKSLQLCRDVLPVFISLGDRKSQADTLISMGEAQRKQGDQAEATVHFTDALRVAQDIGAAHQMAQALRHLGRTEFEEGRLDAARAHLESAVETATRIHDSDEVVEAQVVLADVLAASGQPVQACRLLRLAFTAAQTQDHRATRSIAQRLRELDGGSDG